MQPRVADIDSHSPQPSLAHSGTFDVVLFLKIFYHFTNVIAAPPEVASPAQEVLVVETHIEPSPETRPVMVFYPGDEVGGDGSNRRGRNQICVGTLLSLLRFSVMTVSLQAGARGLFHAYRSRPVVASNDRTPAPGFGG